MAYTPPDIRDIWFVLGDAEVTSPYVSISLPFKVLEAESINNIVTWGVIALPIKTIISEVVNPIPVFVAFELPPRAISSISFNRTVTYFDVTLPNKTFLSYVDNPIVTLGNLEKPTFKLSCEMGSDTVIDIPEKLIISTTFNPTVIVGDITKQKLSLIAVVENWEVATAKMTLPMKKISCECLAEEFTHGTIILTAKTMESVINAGAVIYCDMILPNRLLQSESGSILDYSIIKHHRPGTVCNT